MWVRQYCRNMLINLLLDQLVWTRNGSRVFCNIFQVKARLTCHINDTVLRFRKQVHSLGSKHVFSVWLCLGKKSRTECLWISGTKGVCTAQDKGFSIVPISDRDFHSVYAGYLITLSSYCWGSCLKWGQEVEDSWDECSGSVLDRWLPCLLHSPHFSSQHPREKTKSLILLSLLA